MDAKNTNKMTAGSRDWMIAAISKVIREVGNEKLQEIYLFVLHIQ